MKYSPNHLSNQNFVLHNKRRIWYFIVGILSCLVVFCTAYALIYPALTMSKDCELIEHTHTAELCYSYQKPETISIICTDEAMGVHKHTDECKDKNDELICGYADFVVHSHNELCFDTNGELICAIPELKEHTHQDACYTKVDNEEPILVCKEKEVTLHTHSKDCFDDKKLVICGKTEISEHIHTEACRQISVGEEELVLTCTQKEHTHTPECSSKKSTETIIETTINPTTETTIETTIETTATQTAPLYEVQPASEALGTPEKTGSCTDSITWSYYSDGTLVISGTGNVPNYTATTMPWVADKDSITKVIIEEGITQLGNYAFTNHSALSSVEFPSTLKKIGQYTFTNCDALVDIDLSNTSVTVIDRHGFDLCENLTTVILPDCMEQIHGAAFEACPNLTTINFPENISLIDLWAFHGCQSLISVDLSNTKLKGLGDAAFRACSGIEYLSLPDSMTYINAGAFSGCSSIKSPLDLSNSAINFIGDNVFESCSSIPSIKFPDCLNYLGYGCLSGCSSLTELDLSKTSIKSFSNYTFFACSSLTEIKLPDTLTTINHYVFKNCKSLKSLDLSNTQVNYIGVDAFVSCSDLEYLYFPDTLTTMEYYVFRWCTSLKVLDLSNTQLTLLGSRNFEGCTGLTSVYLPDTLTNIGDNVFLGCTGLNYIEFPDDLSKIGASAFQSCTGLTDIDLSNTSLTTLPQSTFASCSGLTTVKLPDDMTYIDANAFSMCTSLTSIDLPDNLEGLGRRVFYTCSALETIDLSNTKLTTIGQEIFERCYKLSDVYLPDSLESLGTYVFVDCHALDQIDLPDGLTKIDGCAFQYCYNLSSIDLSNTQVTSIGGYSFYYCRNLKSIIFPETLTSIGDKVFETCPLTTIDLSNTNVTSIGNFTFYLCSQITTIKLPDTLTSLGDATFVGPNITSIELPDSLVSIGKSTFATRTNLTSINLPVSLESIGETSFNSCYSLRNVTLQAADLSSIASNSFQSTSIYQLEIADSVEVLYGDVLNSIKPKSITFDRNSNFTYKGSDYSLINNNQMITLTDGASYIVDDKGVISEAKNTIPDTGISWMLKDGVLTISGTGDIPNYSKETPAPWYANASAITKLVIEDGITSIGNNNFKDCINLSETTIPQSVASIGTGAFQNCRSITEISLENSNVSIGNGAFYNCTSLNMVNSLDTLDAVMEEFGLTDKFTFYNTELWNNIFGEDSQVTNAFTAKDSSGRDITLSTTQAGKTLLTGEYADTTLTIDKGDSDQIDYIRIHFAFSDNGYIDLSEGDYTLDNGMEISVRCSDSPNIWFVEVKPLKAGDTLSLTLRSLYSNIITSGGTLDVWMNVLSETACKDLENRVTIPEETHRVTWVTKPAEFPVQKTTSGNKQVLGNGSENGDVAVNNLSYTVKMTKTNQTTSEGQDHMLYAEFIDRLTLSEHFVWANGLIEAIEAGQYSWDGKNVFVTVDGVNLTLCYFNAYTTTTYAWPSVEEDSNGNKTILIHWLHKNINTANEITNLNTTLAFGNNIILVDDIDALYAEMSAAGLSSKTFKFHNDITCYQHFTYSDIQTQTASCDANILVKSGTVSIVKYGNSAVVMGDSSTYSINIANSGSFPYASLTRVQDPLINYFYIHPNQMQTLFNNKNYGKLLTITINDAVLYNEVIRKTVKDINGNDYIITQQDMGTNTPYDNYVSDTTADDPYIRSSSATLSITRAEDQSHLILTVDANDGTDASTYSIGEGRDFATIQDALDGVGYLITANDHYTCEWDMTEEVLYSGETKTFSLPICAKNSLMLLTGDQPWYIKDSDTFQASVGNTASVYYQSGQQPEAKISASVNRKITRDFALYKSVYNVNDPTAEAVEAESGDVLQYLIDLDYAGTASAAYNGAPLVDHMSGAQVLLASVSDNPHLADFNLDIHTVNDSMYFILNKVGTYNSIQIGDFIADHVVIEDADGGISTKIYWYLSSAQSCELAYYSLVDPEKSTLNTSDADAITFALDNEIWLNDHQTHRLYDHVSVKGTRLFIHKYIVDNFPKEELNIKNGEYSAHNTDADNILDRSTIYSGEHVTYRLHLDGRGTNNVAVDGSMMYDVLPESIDSYWTKDNVQLFYTVDGGSTATFSCTDGSEWYIDTDSEGKQFIRWNEDFKINMNGDVYIYVTITLPTGQGWTDYVHTYGSSGLRSSFHVVQLQDEVFHDLGVIGKAMLQKGVLNTGYYKESNFSEGAYIKHISDSALSTYANDGNNKELVTYYVTLYNSGDTRLYLSEIQDVLPKGFGFVSMKRASGNSSISENTSIYNSLININNSDEPVIFKSAYIEARTVTLSDNQTRVMFSLSNTKDTHNLSYDSYFKKYYLNSNEAIVFAYHCSTNGYSKTEEWADNYAAMPIFNYNGYGITIDSDIDIDRAKSEDLISNNGGCDLYDNQQAALIRMDTDNTDGITKWLTSDVRLIKGNIVPGVAKTAKFDSYYTNDDIEWTITATNSGTSAMHAYTITDVMMSPYQFIGDVSYKITDLNGNESSYKLFEFKERSADGTTVTLTTTTETITLQINDEPQPVNITVNSSVTLKLAVSLKVDEAGNEILSIVFAEENYRYTGISPGCSGTLKVYTKNNTNSMKNKAYINTAYITPIQEYDRKLVTVGSNTLLNDQPSVVSEANVAVSYGYATTAVKSVTELNTSNTAQSTSTTNFIVLTDKTNTFRYNLTVNNTGGSTISKAMDMLVLIDNLPEVGDHLTFYDDIKRHSEFDVKFADDPQVVVTVNDAVLDKDKYTIEYSSATTFTDADWSGLESETQWSSDCSDAMRSIRMILKDDTGTLIRENANFTISFNAKVASPTNALPSQIAWNNFGYRYSLTDTEAELEATPGKVGVKIASIPTLYKNLIDSNGDDYPAVADDTSKFLIYQQKAEEFSSFDIATVTEELTSKNIPFTIVEITVNEGSNESETINLDSLKVWELNENGDLVETTTNWIWSDLESYTIVELTPENSIYVFGALNDVRPNNYTFTYQAALPTSLSGTNVRNLWSLQLLKQDVNNHKPLEGSVFALYSKLESDKISSENYEALSEEFGLSPEKTVTKTTDGVNTTWYLMNIKRSDIHGEILWADLTENEYYVVELKAPNGYKLNHVGEVVEVTESGTGIKTVIVTNSPGYKLPLTGGIGTTGFYILGVLMLALAAALLPILRRKSSSQN